MLANGSGVAAFAHQAPLGMDEMPQTNPPRHPDAMSEGDTGSNKAAEEPMAVVAKPTRKRPLRAALSRWWGSGPADGRKKSSDELALNRTDMAATRTLMAADRTLMAWVRTSLSLNSFGFTIYKVLQGFAETGATLPHGDTPRLVGLFMTGMGTLAMLMGTVEYAQSLRDLHELKDIRLTRPAFVMAVLMSVMGVSLFFSIFTKVW
jgi:putative membrane protein